MTASFRTSTAVLARADRGDQAALIGSIELRQPLRSQPILRETVAAPAA